jgi:hypothetical protein
MLINFQHQTFLYRHQHRQIRMKQVSFRSIEIIEVATSLSDNAFDSTGAPLTTQWEAQSRNSFEIDFFETYRPRRRSRRELLISSRRQKDLLSKHGYTMEDILTASKNESQVKGGQRESIVDKKIASYNCHDRQGLEEEKSQQLKNVPPRLPRRRASLRALGVLVSA